MEKTEAVLKLTKMKRLLPVITLSFLIALFFWSCESNDTNSKTNKVQKPKVSVQFNPDSAYRYIQEQVDFGPRVPGSIAHGTTATYLQGKLTEFCDTAFIQYGSVKNYLNQKIDIKNIIGSFNLFQKKRILLCAHWDTRPMADQDSERPNQPSDGANDGASGVGVLIEIARQLQLQRPDAGVDIIFFDAEDMGDSQGAPHTWCLGSQFWSRSPHKKNYVARFGILLDMVGPKDAVFAIEGNSWLYAQPYVKKVWNTAQKLGHGQNFVNYQGGQLVDDHLFINQIIGIPTLDIIHYDIRQNTGFGEFWHTHKDNMESIDRESLKAVGETVFKVVMDL